jgi:transcriptional regulator with XRE-family HTH domain
MQVEEASVPREKTKTPTAVSRSVRVVGEQLATWRKLRRLTAAEVADRAGIDVRTVLSLEQGKGATLENVLRVARALGVLDVITEAMDPYSSDVGRLRADEVLPSRVRKPSRS